jgi:hypothetical protein
MRGGWRRWRSTCEQAVLNTLRDKFALSGGAAQRRAELAHAATDFYPFTSRVNEHVDLPQELRMIELHVPQGTCVKARERVPHELAGYQGPGPACGG